MGASSQQIHVTVNGQEFLVEVGDLSATPVIAVVDGQAFEVVVKGQAAEGLGAAPTTPDRLPAGPSAPRPAQRLPSPGASIAGDRSRVTAPMPGDIVEVLVEAGQSVQVGEALCVLDAMKMKNVIHSPRQGRVARVAVRPGQSVDYGTELVVFE